MCGIAGVLCWGEAVADRAEQVAGRMLTSLRHRGPDGEDIWHHRDDDGVAVALAHSRLAIIDLSDAGRQPMSRGQLVVTFNGETYNYQSLRQELIDQGARFTSGSDTEVLLNAFERWGLDAVQRFSGMFAFGLWDGRARRLTLVRDRMGIKPLYYIRGDGFFAFASEVRALLASDLVPRRLDPQGLWHYLGYQTTPTPATLVEGVRMLEAGHVLTVDTSGDVSQRRYWQLSSKSIAEPSSAQGVRQRVGELLDAAVADHLVSDVPVGLFLSGGIDSGALASVLADRGHVPSTFTVSVGDESLDESEEALAVARAFNTDHHELRISEGDALQLLPSMLEAVDHPSGDGVNTFIVSSVARKAGLKVALSGLGGDEIFGGYPSFRRLTPIMPAVRQWSRVPRPMRRAAADLVRAVGGGAVTATKAAAVLESDGTMATVWPITRQVFSNEERRALLRRSHWPSPSTRDSYYGLLSTADSNTSDETWASVSYAESRAYMHDVLLRDTDQMSMAHALEVRVPLLDHRLVEYVTSLPASIKAGRYPKSLLVESLPLPLPSTSTDRPKRGFTLPFDPWMRGALAPMCERALGSSGLDGRNLFQPGEMTKLWQRFIDRRPGVTWSRVWTLVVLNHWLDRHGIQGANCA